VIYKLPGVATTDNTLRVQHAQSSYLRLKILNGDNPPLRLQQVEAAWIRQNLYFIPAAGRRYTLYFGGEQMRAPEYELRRLLPAQPTRLEQYAAVSLGDIQPHARYNPRAAQGKSTQVEKTLLSVVVLVLAGSLGFWPIACSKRRRGPGREAEGSGPQVSSLSACGFREQTGSGLRGGHRSERESRE
jgi:hypothetical protein